MKTLRIILTVLSFMVIHQFANAQGGCQGKIMMSIGANGCGCWGCQKICVLPSEVPAYQSNGWRIGKCPTGHCCNFIRIGEETGKTETSLTDIYPNPASGLITIAFTLSEQTDVTLRVFDMMGKHSATIANEFFENKINEITWDAGGLIPGIYFLKLQAGDESITRRITVIR